MFADHIASLQAFIDQQQARETELTDELTLVQAGISRAQRAVKVLSGGDDRQSRVTMPSRKHRHVPREQNILKVLAAIEAGAETCPEVEKMVGLSQSTVNYAVYHLRATERIRVTGRKQAGNSPTKVITYAVMPKVAVKGEGE